VSTFNGRTPIRCAIYTRKSTDEGLEQEFNSLDAQREAGEAYIASQRLSGWTCLPERYDDGGYSGGTMERPALARLLKDIQAGKIRVVVVYKVDRLSRSLLDFARMMETFGKYEVSFVSVTQEFNTATSMGRLMLNVLLSFAQFEREIISERTRDKIAAARRKGKWSGGQRSWAMMLIPVVHAWSSMPRKPNRCGLSSVGMSKNKDSFRCLRNSIAAAGSPRAGSRVRGMPGAADPLPRVACCGC
jgi:DNA invertase Pin-like site-specific DNA recombinase